MNRAGWPCLLMLVCLAQVSCGPDPVAVANTVNTVPPAGRLPDGVRPLAYRLQLHVDPREEDFSGSIEIDIQINSAAAFIWMHGDQLEVTQAQALLLDGRAIDVVYSESEVPGVASVSFDTAIPAGRFTLQLDYRARFNRNLAGLFRVEEQGQTYVLAKSESIQARKYMPGFDEPRFKATYDIKLTVPEGYSAIGNSPEVDRQAHGDGMERVVFASTLPMPTYLLSLAVGPFDVVERAAIPPNEFRARSIPLRGFARKGRGKDMNLVLDITPRLVEIFEQQLQIAYPFEKLDIVAAPQWPTGATELSAAITYREQSILVGDNPAPGARLALLEVHAHELAHMWFGNLVTPPWWDDLWLKEGIATWSEPVVLSIFDPSGGHDIEAALTAFRAMQLDSLASTRAIREPISDNKNIRNAYDAITYSKSLGVIHMADQYFGADRFRPALGRYLHAFAGGVADSPAFYAVIGEQTDTPELTESFRSFVEQRGVPQIDVTLHCDNVVAPRLAIRQSRYRPSGSPIEGRSPLWSIPACIRSDRSDLQCLMLVDAETTLELDSPSCPRWVMPNANGGGYYRWNLAEPMWHELLSDFETFEPVEALSTIDSAFAAFEAGSMSARTLSRVIRLAALADTRQVIVAALPHLEKYRRNYLAQEDQAGFLRFAQATYRPVMERVAEQPDNDSRLLQSELSNFMALHAKDPQVRQQLLNGAMAFAGFARKRDAAALNSDLYMAALTVAVQDGDENFITHLLELLTELDDPLFERAAADAIGRSNNSDHLADIHDLVLGGRIGPREAYRVISSALRESTLREQHWTWLQENFTDFVARIPEQWRRFTPGLGGAFCDSTRLAELILLFDVHGDLVPGYQRRLAQTIEQIELCIALREQGRAFVSALDAQ